MVWQVRLKNVVKNETTISIDYQVIKDNVVVKTDSVTLEGDIIDFGALKGRMLKMVRRLKGIDEKSNQIIGLANSSFTLNDDATDLIKD